MSSKARTPVNWPRMKVRGARRRRLAAERREVRTYFPALVVTGAKGGAYTFSAPPPGTPGTMKAVIVQHLDGYGRAVRKIAHVDKVEAVGTPPTFTISGRFNVIDPAVFDLVFGQRERRAV